MIKIPNLCKKINSKVQRIGVLTSGGDAPGMNAAIRAVVRFGIAQDREIYGIHKGYRGLLDESMEKMHLSSVANIIQRGGTILKTDRCEPFFKKEVRKQAADFLKRKRIDALVVIGGDGSFAGAAKLEKENGIPCIGIPGTIDNDIQGTDETIGFDTAVNTALGAIDRIRDTASSHDRVFFVEVMGRSTGFIAMNVGLAGGSEVIVLPNARDSSSQILKAIRRATERGKHSSIIVVAEGPNPGLATRLSERLKKKQIRSKVCILGHIQRGGAPTARDRVLASVLGAASVRELLMGNSYGMVGIQNGSLRYVHYKKIGARKHDEHDLDLLAEILAT